MVRVEVAHSTDDTEMLIEYGSVGAREREREGGGAQLFCVDC